MKNCYAIFLGLISIVSIELSGQTEFKTLNYLYGISGARTAAGQHNREPNAEPSMWTDSIRALTGVYPRLWSGDFLFQEENIKNRWSMILEAERQWEKGAIVNIMWHACSPLVQEPCSWGEGNGVLNPMNDEEWQSLLTYGTPVNQAFYKRLDELAVYLAYLKTKGVEVMFRPFHEMNQGLFWWGGRPGENGTAALFRLTHNYLTKEKGLDNLIWVWNVQDLSFDWEAYNPGAEYWDVMSLDVYDEAGFTQRNYELMLEVSGGKPFGIGECAKLPTEDLLTEQPRWVFFMAWAELVFEHNTKSEIKSLYSSPRVEVIAP
ncbi:glycoside hydrolase family 26 protein [Geofilum rubicundum]|nr:glycosyl hydrolase [Geofilum rubicundum]